MSPTHHDLLLLAQHLMHAHAHGLGFESRKQKKREAKQQTAERIEKKTRERCALGKRARAQMPGGGVGKEEEKGKDGSSKGGGAHQKIILALLKLLERVTGISENTGDKRLCVITHIARLQPISHKRRLRNYT